MPRRAHPSKASRARRRNLLAGRWGVLAGILLVLVLIAIFIAFKPAASPPLEISVDQAYQRYQDGAFILDVREQSEWDAFHIPGATLIPLGQLGARLEEVPSETEIIVVCRSGNRSQTGRDILLEAGFSRVTSMRAGVTAWSNAGYPIEGVRP